MAARDDSGTASARRGLRAAAGAIGALVLLNLSLAFDNVWPTLRVAPTVAVSVELAGAVLVLALARRLPRATSAAWLRGLTLFWLALVAGRYIDVTTRALYGRDLNLYWDLRHVPSVGAMFARVASPWQLVALGAGALAAVAALYLAVRWALGRVDRALATARVGAVLVAVAGLVVTLFVVDRAAGPPVSGLRFADPVTPAYAREIVELVYEWRGAGVAALGPVPALDSDLARLGGADVFIVFIESYGAVSWEEPRFREALGDARAALARDIAETGREVVSATVESTTFGGESWLAHISLLSGTEVRDQGTNVRLMAQDRATLVTVFRRAGYHTVAVMPGLLLGWPEGAFYGFDDVYDLARLDYRGPPFGWWSVTDQYTLARVDRAEIAPRDRAPRFVFFPTISTHAPFTPAPPYQPEWPRMLSAQPYDQAALDRAWAEWPDWLDLGPSYVKALEYAYATLGGYLRLRADRELVLVVVGDHQPPALVSGEDASWNVPVHVVARPGPVLDRLRAAAFRNGLTPPGPALTRMDKLGLLLLDVFGEAAPIVGDGRGPRGVATPMRAQQ